jgi:dihydrofolate reductase
VVREWFVSGPPTDRRVSVRAGRIATMAITQYYTATTLDGFIADADNSLQWLFDVDEAGDGAGDEARIDAGNEAGDEAGDETGGPPDWDEFFGNVGAMAMGSTTWEWVVAHEDLVHHPEKWTAVYADRPCWVFSSRQPTKVPGIDVRFVKGDVAPVHAEMTAAAAGRNVWIVGGGDLVGQFHDAGLLDQVIATVAPVTLGGGAPLLPRRIEGMRLRDVKRVGPMVTLTYDVPKSGNR